MFDSDAPDSNLLKELLQPLLDDFQHWFGRSRSLLESHRIEFLSELHQADVLNRVKAAQQEVATTQMMLNATDGQVGVEMSVLMPWHQLVTECWQITLKFRLNEPANLAPEAEANSSKSEKLEEK